MTTLQKHLRSYYSYVRNLDDFLTALDTRDTGHRSHKILCPGMLNSYSETTEVYLKKQDSQFEFVFENLCQYYGEPLVISTNAAAMLVVQILILIRHVTQTCM